MNNSNWPVDPDSMKHGKYWQDGITVVAGCSHISAGCKNCWSADIAHRFRKHDLTTDAGKWTGEIKTQEHLLKRCETKKPKVIAFWNDLFHEDVPESFHKLLIQTIMDNPQHVYLLLTKRPENIPSEMNQLADHDNVFIGVTVESTDEATRIPELRFRWTGRIMISLEPLLKETCFNVNGLKLIDWIVIGAESGPRRRRCELSWVHSIVYQCTKADVPVFVKQVHINGRLIKDMSQWPKALRVRQTPEITRFEQPKLDL